jgi:hypothetical protein
MVCRVTAAALISLMLFKEAFVRQDVGHIGIGFAGLTAAIVLFGADSWTGTHRQLVKAGTMVLVLVAGSLFCIRVTTDSNGDTSFLPTALWRIAEEQISSIETFAKCGDRCLRAQYQQSLLSLRSKCPLSPAHGTVDIYPVDDNTVLANKMRLTPRPMFQSYAATARYLIERNVGVLQGGVAPDTIFFQVSTIDTRLPALDDGASWPMLLSRYEIRKETEAPYLRLDRRAVPEPYEMLPAARMIARLNRGDIQVPSDGSVVWARIKLKRSALGTILSILFKEPIVQLELDLEDGSTRQYRLVPGSARTGFILSPLVETNTDFAALRSPPFQKQVKAIRIATSSLGLLAYRSRVMVSLYRLVFTCASRKPYPG